MSATLIDRAAHALRPERVRHLVEANCRRMDETLHRHAAGRLSDDAVALRLAALESVLAVLRRQLGDAIVDGCGPEALRDIEREMAQAETGFFVPPGWRRVEPPRFKKDYRDKYVMAEDFSRVHWGDKQVPPNGAVCLLERRYAEGAGQEFQLLLGWHCPYCGLHSRVSVPESWIEDGRLVFVEREVSNGDRA